MKKIRFIPFLATIIIGSTGFVSAQDYEDDIYYNPDKKAKSVTVKPSVQNNQYNAQTAVQDYPAADTYTPALSSGSKIDVDTYNRRGMFASDNTQSTKSSSTTQTRESFAGTRNIERFYNPDIIVSSNDEELAELYYSEPSTTNLTINVVTPDYWGYPYSGYSPFWNVWNYPRSSWYYNNWYYNNWAWNNWNWGPSWSWGWSPSWSWGWGYGPSWSWYPGHSHHYYPSWTHRPVVNNRPSGNIRPGYRPSGNQTVGNRPSGNVRPGYRPGYNNTHTGTATSGSSSSGYRSGYRTSGNSSSVTTPPSNNSSSGYRSGYRSNNSSSSSSGSSYRNSSSGSSYRSGTSGSSYRSGGSSSRSAGGASRGSSGGGRGRH
ncbi:MAG: hypothetical protein K2M94_01625 [Paramuribaculum sp.]|nr:hypothetical protein [Paramuribaculum sp.]